MRSKFKQFAPTIIQQIQAGRYAGQIARSLGVSKQTMSNWMLKLENGGYIRRVFRAGYVQYRIVQLESQNILVDEEKGVDERGILIGMENYALRAPILRNAVVPFTRKIKLNNGEQFFSKYGGITVRKTEKSVVFHYKKLVGGSPKELLDRAQGDILGLKDRLERDFGLVLGDFVPSRKPEFVPKGPAASLRALDRAGRVASRTVDGAFNSSGGAGNEVEFFNPLDAVDWPSVPSAVRELRARVDEFEKLAFYAQKTFEPLIQNVEVLNRALLEIKETQLEILRAIQERKP